MCCLVHRFRFVCAGRLEPTQIDGYKVNLSEALLCLKRYAGFAVVDHQHMSVYSLV